MATPHLPGLAPGDVLAGKYRVERVLGVGGMGVVVAAHHLHLDERVALKFLLPEAARNQEAVTRFLREARAAVKIKSEHVARVTDVGQLENGSAYIVMEYLEGSDLSGWLEKRGALPADQAVDFVLQACEAIADAHALGIVHRDLKPANLFCIQRSDGGLSIKVLDFGISKITTPGDTGHSMTRTTALMGSPAYMSPEQMTGSKGVDVRTDIWALGVILFELVTGRVPFAGESVTELAIRVATEPAPPLRQFRHDAAPGLESAISRCLEKDRANRFQNVGELALALRDFGPRSARVSVERVLGTLRKVGMSDAAAPPSERPELAATSLAPSPAPVKSAPLTAASWGQTGPGKATGTGRIDASKAALLLAVTTVVVSAAVWGAVVFRRPPASVLATPPESGSVVVSPPSPVLPPVASPPPVSTILVPDIPPSATSNSPPVQPPPVATVKSAQKSGPTGHPPPAAPTHPIEGAAPPAGKNCNPPYVIDSSGHRQYKPECLN